MDGILKRIALAALAALALTAQTPPYQQGSNGKYPMTVPDILRWTTSISGGGTVRVIDGHANANLYVYLLGWENRIARTGVGSVDFVSGEGNTCAVNRRPIGLVQTEIPPEPLDWVVAWGFAPPANHGFMATDSVEPLIITSGAQPVNVCVITGGTGFDGAAVAHYTIHAR